MPILYLLNSILQKDQDLSRLKDHTTEKPKEAGWLKTAGNGDHQQQRKSTHLICVFKKNNSAILQTGRKS